MTTNRTMNAPSPGRKASRERGAALILTVIVIMVLTTLGIAMVTFTTTEERTASTFRDAAQARMVAEAGVRLVQQMFYTPTDRDLVPLYSSTGTADNSAWDYWGSGENATETQLNEIGIWRAARPGASPGRYVGASNGFLKPPFGSGWADVFGGTYAPTNDVYDLRFNCRNPSDNNLITNWATTCWLHTKLNALIDNSSSDWNLQTGRITDISFYGPPQVNGAAYGIATVRVTAEKRESWPDGTLLSRETMIAIIGDATPKPAVFGDGNVIFATTGNRDICGNGCIAIHANGDLGVGNLTGGEDPMATASGGTISGTTSTQIYGSDLVTPEINPWDLTYRPSTSPDLDHYYLAAARQLDVVWTDDNAGNNPAPRPCGNMQFALCQDYQLEYEAPPSTTPKADRSSSGTAYLYQWDQSNKKWVQCDSRNSNGTLGPGTCTGAPSFSVTRANDAIVGSTTDDADIPFRALRVPAFNFRISDDGDDAIVLVDGKFDKHSAGDYDMTVIAAGSIQLHSSTSWKPTASNKVMFITGRDFSHHSSYSAGGCPVDADTPDESGIVAAHEQIAGQSNATTAGIMIAENKVNHDTLVNSTVAITENQTTHAYACNEPTWPWALPTTPVILSMSTASD